MQLLFIQINFLILWFWHAQHHLFLSLSLTHTHTREKQINPLKKKGIVTTTEVPKNESGRVRRKRDQLSFYCKSLISRPNVAVKMAYDSPIIPLSKQVSWPPML